MVCRCDGVLCGSGSLSDEEDDGELDESEEACSGVPCAGLSPSGSSLGLWGFEGPDTKPGSLAGGGLASAVVSIGVVHQLHVGSSSFFSSRGWCSEIHIFGSGHVLWFNRLASWRISYVRVSNEVAIRRCSGAALMRVPP